MKVVEVAFIGYSVTDLKRARKFYEEILCLIPSRIRGDEERGWIEYDVGHVTISIGNAGPEWKPNSGGGSIVLEVQDFQRALEKLKECDLTPVFGPMETPYSHMAVITDPDGNSITLHKRK
jgi:predicted enzyme related to lactoylglutathione lyase